MTTETTDPVSEAAARIGALMEHRSRLDSARDRTNAAKDELDAAIAEWRAASEAFQDFLKTTEEDNGIFNREQRRAAGSRRRVT